MPPPFVGYILIQEYSKQQKGLWQILFTFCKRSRNFAVPDPGGVITIIAAGEGRRPKPVVKNSQKSYNPVGVEQNTLTVICVNAYIIFNILRALVTLWQ